MADVLCGAIAALFLNGVRALIEEHHRLLSLAGGIFVLILGVKTLFSRTYTPGPNGSPSGPRQSFVAAFISTFLLTIANPMTLLGMVAVVAAIGLGSAESVSAWLSATILVGGIFIGSVAWWFFLTGCISWFGGNLSPKTQHVINRVAAILIIGFGLWQLLSFTRGA